MKFIATYDKTCGDTHKLFATKKELAKWVKEAREDEEIVFKSIKAYNLGPELKISLSVRLK